MGKKRSDRIFFTDIIESMELIQNYINDVSEFDFENDSEKQDAVIRRFEIIGEAAKNISEKSKELYKDIPWREMAGMRDVIIHQYFGINMKMIWEVIMKDIPRIKSKLKKINLENL